MGGLGLRSCRDSDSFGRCSGTAGELLKVGLAGITGSYAGRGTFPRLFPLMWEGIDDWADCRLRDVGGRCRDSINSEFKGLGGGGSGFVETTYFERSCSFSWRN